MLTTNKENTSNKWIFDLFFLTLFLSLFYAVWLGAHALFTPDEGRYSEVAREMLVTGDFITPRLNGVVFLDKPILYYWLQASAIFLFGLKEWALRFWPAFIGILGCLMTYIAGRALFNRRTGLLATLVLATAPLYYGAAHYANLDLEVAAFIGISLMSFIVGIQAQNKKIYHFFLINAYVFAGLAALTKGLIGLAFPGMIIGTWIILSGHWSTIRKMHLLKGLCIFILIAGPWYVLVQKANPEFFDFFFMKQQVSRFLTTEYFNNRTPIWFYVPIVLAGTFPWCAFIIQALGSHLKQVCTHRNNHVTELYLLIWIFLVFIFFSVPHSKTIGYILPIFPALALLLGKYLSDSWNTLSKGMLSGLFIFMLIAIVSSIVCFVLPFTQYLSHPNMASHLILTSILLLTASTIIGILLFKRQMAAPAIVVIGLTAILFLFNVNASSSAVNQKTIKPLATQIKPLLKSNDEIVAFYKYYQDLPIYLERRITIVADWQAKDIPLKDNWRRELWYGMGSQNTKEWLIGETTFWERWNSDKRLWVFVDKGRSKLIYKTSTKPVYAIAQYNDVLLLSNQPS